MFTKTLASALGFCCLAGQASADVLATRTRTLAYTSSATSSAKVFIPTLNANGSNTLPFVTTHDNQRVVITYIAECSVQDDALSAQVWLDLDIQVDNVVTVPTSDDQAYCTSDDQNGGNWTSVVAAGVVVVPDPGLHTVSIKAGLAGGTSGDNFRIDDATLIVQE
jgi:hypothetical protein